MNILRIVVLLFVGLLSVDAATEKSDKLGDADFLLKQNEALSECYTFCFRDRQFVGYPNVYSPVIFPGAKNQGSIPLSPDDDFLEIGCGTGIFSVLAALDGAHEVVALDINPDAVANTLDNAKRHQVESKVTVLQSDMFGSLGSSKQFDVIFFNIPFCHRNCAVDDLSMLGRALFDPEHDLLHRFFKEGGKHLREGGRMVLGYSTTHGDVPLMREWATQYGWTTTLLWKVGDEAVDFITVEMYEFTRR